MPATPRRHLPSSNGNEAGSCAASAQRRGRMTVTRDIAHIACAAALGFALWGGGAGRVAAQDATHQDPWPQLADQVFNGRPLADGTGLIAIEMPARAEDAAIVPVTVRVTLPTGDRRRFNAITIVIDENPAPVAATFHIGPDALVSSISTRVRVNSYTNVHAVAELSDGKLYVAKTYVKASGGCSAPAAKNAEQAGLGELRFRQFARPAETGNLREAQIMIRHRTIRGCKWTRSHGSTFRPTSSSA